MPPLPASRRCSSDGSAAIPASISGRTAAGSGSPPTLHLNCASRERATSDSVTYDVDALRAREFPWAARGERIYLDHAATGPLPQRAREVQAEANEFRAEMWRVGFEYFWDGVVRGREFAAALINASPDEIA